MISEPDSDSDATLALPRANGELVFAEPWERRVFGVTVALCEAGHLDWESFQAALISKIGADGAIPDRESGDTYYSHWLSALETLLLDMQVLDGDLIRTRIGEIASRPHGHDHRPQDVGNAPANPR